MGAKLGAQVEFLGSVPSSAVMGLIFLSICKKGHLNFPGWRGKGEAGHDDGQEEEDHDGEQAGDEKHHAQAPGQAEHARVPVKDGGVGRL